MQMNHYPTVSIEHNDNYGFATNPIIISHAIYDEKIGDVWEKKIIEGPIKINIWSNDMKATSHRMLIYGTPRRSRSLVRFRSGILMNEKGRANYHISFEKMYED